MKLIFASLLSIFTLIGYVNVNPTKDTKLTKEDKEFKELMSDFNKTLEHNKGVQVKADKTKDNLIVITTNKITQLSNENKELKIELNEIKEKLDSISTDTGSSFKLLPISINKEN
jgi:hypothetical protein